MGRIVLILLRRSRFTGHLNLDPVQHLVAFQVIRRMLDGKPVIISFFATWCKPCMRELNAIEDLYSDWQDETGVEMYIVSIDQAQDAQKVMPLVDGNGWEYHVLLDPNGTLKRAMNVQNVPHLFVLNSKGEIVYNHAGYMDGEELEIRKYLK